MKYDITPEDLKKIEHDMKHDRTLKHLKNMSFYKFAIGDVLIREDKRYNTACEQEWKIKLADCGLPNKYVYVFENELGIGYIRRLSVNGRYFVDTSVCVTEFDPDQTRFTLDPEYADHMMLAEENADFDTKTRYEEVKKKREQINRKNKKLRLQFHSEQDVKEWMKTLKTGDTFWWGYSLSNINKNPYYVQQVNLFPNEYYPNSSSIEISSVPNTPLHGYKLAIKQLFCYSVFMQRPLFVDEIIN